MNRFLAWETHNLARFANEANARIQELETEINNMKSHAPKLRELLTLNLDGMTLDRMSDAVGIANTDTLRRCLEAMPDVYIDRWEGPYRGQWAAVYCVHLAPPNCPRPDHA
jgi:hypothetical protein